MSLEKDLGAEKVLVPWLRGTSVHIWILSQMLWAPILSLTCAGTNFKVYAELNSFVWG
jgi:hypothetical protein